MDTHGREQTIADYLAVLRRYKWLIIVAALVVPVAAYTMSARQPKVFSASADVLVNRQELGSTVTGLTTQGWVDPERYMRNQAALARVPDVLRAAVAKAGVRNMEGWQLGMSSNVSPRGSTDLLGFSVENGDQQTAARLVNAYAEAFTEYKLEMDTGGLERARTEIQARLAELRAAGNAETDTYRELARKAQDLRTLEFLQTPASVVRTAGSANQIAPNPQRNATLGLMLGLVLGIGGAFLLNAFDRRVRHADEVERELQIPLLAKLPTPRGWKKSPTILDRPPDEMTEAVGRLRTSFDFANAEPRAKVLMVTSAGPREGKSTTIANLAIALARTGRRVVLVDLDLRRPSLARLLHLPERAGITDIGAGHAELADVLAPIVVTPLRARLSPLGKADVGSGSLEVVTAGRLRVDPPEFIETSGLTEALHKLRNYAEIVLVDAPPIVASGDAMALTGKVDAIVLVTRLGALTRPALAELRRVLGRSPAPVLGWIATGAEIDESYAMYQAQAAYTVPGPARAADGRAAVGELDLPEAQSAAGGSGRWTPRRPAR